MSGGGWWIQYDWEMRNREGTTKGGPCVVNEDKLDEMMGKSNRDGRAGK